MKNDLLTCILTGVQDANPQHLKFYMIPLKLLDVVYVVSSLMYVKLFFFYYVLLKAFELNKSRASILKYICSYMLLHKMLP